MLATVLFSILRMLRSHSAELAQLSQSPVSSHLCFTTSRNSTELVKFSPSSITLSMPSPFSVTAAHATGTRLGTTFASSLSLHPHIQPVLKSGRFLL